MHHYSHHIGDYRRDTGHLTLLEHGIYRQLLDTYYLDEVPIPNSFPAVCRRLSARSQEEQEAVKAVVKEFFTLRDGHWHHSRCDSTIEAYKQRQIVNSANGKQGGRGKKKQSESDSLTKGKATSNQKPRTRNQSPLPPEGEAAFEVFWQAYPRKEKKPDALRAFAKAMGYTSEKARCTLEELVAGIAVWVTSQQWTKDGGGFIPHPSSWLNADQWNEKPLQAGAGGEDVAGWWDSKSGIEAKGAELGIPPPADDSPHAFAKFKARVWVAAGPDGLWWNPDDAMTFPLAQRLRNGS